jgi:hypothetical protein
VHGNLEFLDEEKARWFARAQRLYEKLQAEGRTKSFGGIPGNVEPYGFGSFDTSGAVYTVMNPAQAVRELELPRLSRVQQPLGPGRIIFADAGFAPVLQGARITLGPGQMAAVGFGRYASTAFDFGVQEDVVIARGIVPVDTQWVERGKNTIEAVIQPPAKGDLRILFQQRDQSDNIMRSWPGGPPNGKSVATVLRIVVEQNGKPIPVELAHDKVIWSGLSWGAGEVRRKDFANAGAITVRCSSEEKGALKLDGQLYAVTY